MSSRGVNKVIIVGNLGQEPESRFMPSGGQVCTVSVATSEAWKDKQTGEQQTRTEWHRVVFMNRLAEIAAQYLKKGSKIYIEGRLRTRKWEDNTGQTKYTTEIMANELQMLDSRGGSAGMDDGMSSSQASGPAPSAFGQENVLATTESFEDDIPF